MVSFITEAFFSEKHKLYICVFRFLKMFKNQQFLEKVTHNNLERFLEDLSSYIF
jgi:hypothetical protein